jgi:hypothetical protein
MRGVEYLWGGGTDGVVLTRNLAIAVFQAEFVGLFGVFLYVLKKTIIFLTTGGQNGYKQLLAMVSTISLPSSALALVLLILYLNYHSFGESVSKRSFFLI